MIIISNGFNKFYLAAAASEMDRRHLLSEFITGAYPKGSLATLISGTPGKNVGKLARLLARREDIYDQSVTSLWGPEGLYQFGLFVGRACGIPEIGRLLERKGLRLYGRGAVPAVKRAAANGAKIYHYRAGFGQESVRVAKAAGLIALCDYSIAHPEVLEYLVENKGRMPHAGSSHALDPLWGDINEDIEQADAVLVNSHFVKETFVNQGWDSRLIHVLYLGVDDQFLKAIPRTGGGRGPTKTFQILFSGAFEKRKGAEELLQALHLLEHNPWELTIAGNISPDIRRRFADELKDERIRHLGWVSRSDLAAEMVKADAFIFPSLAEGSARVVFEALACGCYVITTPNSGSIVEDGVHGRLVPAGEADSLASAIREAMDLPREQLRETGRNNAQLVRERYRQSDYGDRLLSLYRDLVGIKPQPAVGAC